MANVEILVKVGDGEGLLDGMPITARGPGVLLDPVALAAWWTSNIEPPALATVALDKQEEVRRQLKVSKYLTDPARTIAEATERKFGTEPPSPTLQQQLIRKKQEADVWYLIEITKLERTTYAAEGYDTNWGALDLRKHLVLVADLTPEQVQELLQPPDDPSVPEFGERRDLRARRWRIPYETFVTAPQLAQIQDPDVRWDVKRQATPLTYAQCQGTIP